MLDRLKENNSSQQRRLPCLFAVSMALAFLCTLLLLLLLQLGLQFYTHLIVVGRGVSLGTLQIDENARRYSQNPVDADNRERN